MLQAAATENPADEGYRMVRKYKDSKGRRRVESCQQLHSLVGGFNPSKILVNMDDYDYSQCMETCSKPPTSSKWPPTEVRTLNWTHYLSGSVFSGMKSSIQGWIPRSQEVSSIS